MKIKIEAASYGGAFDISDTAYFTRDDLDEFSEDVIEKLSDATHADIIADVVDCYLDEDTNELELTLSYNEYEHTHKEKIDMRKIKKPKDLIKAYSHKFVNDFLWSFTGDTEHEEMIKESISNTNLVDNPEKPKKSRPSGKLQRQIEDSAINELGGSMFDMDGYYGRVVEMPSKVSLIDFAVAISNEYRKNGYETIFWTNSGSESLKPTKEFSVVFGSNYEMIDYIIGVDTENSAKGKKYYTMGVTNVF